MDPVLTSHVREADAHTLESYVRRGGYQGLRKALALSPAQVIEVMLNHPMGLAKHTDAWTMFELSERADSLRVRHGLTELRATSVPLYDSIVCFCCPEPGTVSC